MSRTFLACLLAGALCVNLTGCAMPVPPPTAGPAPTFTPDLGFQALTLTDFDQFGTGNWSGTYYQLTCQGTERGYLYSKETFGDFTWRLEYRFFPPADPDDAPNCNTGFMIHIQEPHKVWPASLEVQGKQAEMATIKSNGGVPDLVIVDHPEVREAARKPVGEWNEIEIVSSGGALTAKLNGELICESEPGELTEGLIGLQSEGYQVEFRNLQIRRDEADVEDQPSVTE